MRDASSDWLRQASENLQKGSPSTAAITWLLWQWGKQVHSWDEVFDLEAQISEWKIRHPDFVEGVRARLVDKDLSPEWKACEDLTLRGILLMIHRSRRLIAGMHYLDNMVYCHNQ